MNNFESNLSNADIQLEGVAASAEKVSAVSSTLSAELASVSEGMSLAGESSKGLSKGLNSSFKRAFSDIVFSGAKASDVLQNVGQSLLKLSFNQAIAPLTNSLAGLVGSGVGAIVNGILPFEKGAAFSGGQVRAFAKGGVVASPTHFPMKTGVGLMGEAGPEAIMPLTRGADGALGVRAQSGGSTVNVTMNISTPDAAGFQRSKTQIAAGLQRAIKKSGRIL